MYFCRWIGRTEWTANKEKFKGEEDAKGIRVGYRISG
jgi:hypothetical protein